MSYLYLFTFALLLPLSIACDNQDRYLCRMCGHSAGDAGQHHDIVSPLALSLKNQTWNCGDGNILSQNVLVQKLENPAGVQFNVVTVKQSSCKGIGKWSTEFSWYPGYSWKACVCRQCGRHIGWMFEPDVETSKPERPSDSGFYALISENLLTESVAQTLAFTPKLFRQ